jgi:hypothetical protein
MLDYSQLKVPDLKKILQERGLVISGNKADLVARLQEHDKKSGGGTGKWLFTMVSELCIQCACYTNIHIQKQAAKTRSIGTKMITGQQRHQLQQPQQQLRPEAKVKSKIPLLYQTKSSTSTLLKQRI